MASKNPCSKTVKPDHAYEVWQSFDGSWTWYVLKKYQSPDKEAQNPFARWYCFVQSPMTPQGEFGDVYVATVKHGNHRVLNPLRDKEEQLIALWQALCDVPMNEEEALEQDFFLWSKGTPCLVIWHWFDEQYHGGLAALQSTDKQTTEQEAS